MPLCPGHLTVCERTGRSETVHHAYPELQDHWLAEQKKSSYYMAPTNCSAYYPATDQRSGKVQEVLRSVNSLHFLRWQLRVIHSCWLVRYWESRGCWSPSSSRMRRRRWSASCDLEMWSRLADREHGLCEEELQVLCPWGEGDLEGDSEQWRLGALLRNGGEDWRPRDDRRDCWWDAGDRRRSDKDGCPVSLLVIPAL